jgi:glycine betaine/proline transport system ATP-binding protein
MNPISMLTAADVMQQGLGQAASGMTVSATARPATPLVDILDALSRQPGSIGVVENGAIVGTISAQDIVNGLTQHRRKEQA